MSSLAFRFLFLATLFALVGMAWGIQMSITTDHTLSPAHAHSNLIGFVTLAIYGLFYAVVPAAAKGGLAESHFWLALLGAVLMGPGIAMAITGQTEIVAIAASIATILAMLMFTIIVFVNRAALSR